MLATKYLRRSVNTVLKTVKVAAMAVDSFHGTIETKIVPIENRQLGYFKDNAGLKSIESWEVPETSTPALQTLRDAAKLLRESCIPVAFPTETVYGLGADATRSKAVKGIYEAKGRPSDNPLIIHICDLKMLRDVLFTKQSTGHFVEDPILAIYKPLIDRFWPGPLTILLSEPEPSILAPEVTAGLKTFGVRMPDSPLALTLIKLAGVPIAAPSANASTKPSTTTAAHVLHDLDGRIEVILDGGHCQVGVESTIVDGLCSPPVILRPGGVSINSIRQCKGWEKVRIAYKDELETNGDAPRAPGMKYKHYSPKAKIILAENSANIIPKDLVDFKIELGSSEEATLSNFNSSPFEEMENGTLKLPIVGVVRTRHWTPWGGFNESSWTHVVPLLSNSGLEEGTSLYSVQKSSITGNLQQGYLYTNESDTNASPVLIGKIIEISLGTNTKTIAHGLFAALRELDRRNVDLIYVEGIDDDGYNLFAESNSSPALKQDESNIAAAIMNRLRKAATV